MRTSARIVFTILTTALVAPAADDLRQQTHQMELSGDAAGARAALQKAAAASNADAITLLSYAEFLERHHDPGARAAYGKALAVAKRSSDTATQAQAARRLVILDLLANERKAATGHLDQYHAAGKSDLSLTADSSPTPADAAAQPESTVSIPGPMRSFARMAALSPDLSPNELLMALARNVVTSGFQAGNGSEGLEQTEYLKLIVRYLSQARELEALSGKDKTISIETCDSPQTADLLRVLGYRMRGGCGAEVVLETVNATRAFLTIDSGFPLADLEQALRTNRPFKYDYHPASVPVLYTADYWISSKDKQQSGEFIDQFLTEPSLCRLYLGLSKLDRATADELRKQMTATKLRAFSHVLDFYGGMFQIQNGKALIPGGQRSAKAWQDLVGANPDQGAAFYEKLVARDDGWLASYYDSIARVNGPLRDYLTEPARLKRYYTAIRGKLTSPGPARPVFRANTDMILLTSRLRLDANGQPHIPGSVDVWKDLFIHHPHGKYDGKLTKSAVGWKDPDDVVEALFALSRKTVENEPLKIFMALSEIDRRREHPISPAMATRLAHDYKAYGSQYSLFTEFPTLSEKSITDYLETADAIGQIRDMSLRADTAGMFQSLVGLWQILSRQESIPVAGQDKSLGAILDQFGKSKDSRELFDSGRQGVRILLTATGSSDNVSPQDRLIDLLAGSNAADQDAHLQLAEDMIRTFEAQRLISLTTLFELSDHLEGLTKGGKLNAALVNKATARIMEVQLPRAALSSTEKNSLAFGYWTEKHIESQRKINIRGLVEKAQNDPAKLQAVRGQLTPLLRDTLVGFNYINYAPPGGQLLQTNSLFVRSHDFVGNQSMTTTWKTTEVYGTGWPSSAGGRLTGSLINLPYAMAEADQNFLIPSREQALIWGDLVPQMIVSAKVPRYWKVTPAQLHWVGLHMRLGESFVAEAALNPERRTQLLDAYSKLAAPARVRRVELMLEHGDASGALDNIMPSELFDLAASLADVPQAGVDQKMVAEIKQMGKDQPKDVNYAVISREFGTPKPMLSNSYNPELLHIRTFPTLMGYSSRIMAETWESNNLYYAALADELHLSPAQLNVLIPVWTRMTVEKIFATHLEDWPALLRSLRLVGDEVRAQSRAEANVQQKAALQ